MILQFDRNRPRAIRAPKRPDDSAFIAKSRRLEALSPSWVYVVELLIDRKLAQVATGDTDGAR